MVRYDMANITVHAEFKPSMTPKERAALNNKLDVMAATQASNLMSNALGNLDIAKFMVQTADTMTPGELGRYREVENGTRVMQASNELMKTALECMKFIKGVGNLPDSETKLPEKIEYYGRKRKKPKK